MKKYFEPKKTLVETFDNGETLSIWHLELNCWTFCHTHNGNDNRVGSMFPNKTALMIEAKEYIERSTCISELIKITQSERFNFSVMILTMLLGIVRLTKLFHFLIIIQTYLDLLNLNFLTGKQESLNTISMGAESDLKNKFKQTLALISQVDIIRYGN